MEARARGQIEPGEQAESLAGCRERALGDRLQTLIARPRWLGRLGDGLNRAVGAAMDAAGPNVTDLLHGTMLRHPLHPALTDLPIGGLIATSALDAAGDPKLGRLTDVALALTIAGGLAAAPAGFADWRHLSGHSRRVGVVHAALNVATLALAGASLVSRRRGDRPTGIALALLGLGLVSVSGWLGGHLIYAEGVGVDRTAFESGPRDFTPALRESELPEGKLTRARVGGVNVLLFRRNGRVSAIAETCSHRGGPLAEGQVEGDTVVCPWHGSRFRLASGQLVHGPSTFDQPCFETRARDGVIEVRRSRLPR